MLTVLPDYQGVVYSPSSVRFTEVLTALFGGTASHPHQAQSIWELPGVGKWKIDYGTIFYGHIPLRSSGHPVNWAVQIQMSIPKGFGFRVSGKEHWRLFDFYEIERPGLVIGSVHLANRD